MLDLKADQLQSIITRGVCTGIVWASLVICLSAFIVCWLRSWWDSRNRNNDNEDES